MKTTLQKYKTALAQMPREELEALALGVAISLYGVPFVEGDDDLTEDEVIAFALAEGDLFFNSEKEWSGDTLPDVAQDLEAAGLTVERVAGLTVMHADPTAFANVEPPAVSPTLDR